MTSYGNSVRQLLILTSLSDPYFTLQFFLFLRLLHIYRCFHAPTIQSI